MKLRNIILTICIGLGMLVISCKKGGNENPTPQTPTDNNVPDNNDNNNNSNQKGILNIHLHTYISDTEVDGYNITYPNEDGRRIRLSLSQFYISEFQLEKLDGTLVSVDNKKLIKTLNTPTYELGEVAVGNYKSLRFKVGLPSATNTSEPAATGDDSTMLKRTEMWFNTTPQPDGYVYLNVQGLVDTSAALDGTQMAPFTYKIGTNTHYKQVVVNQNFGVSPGQVTYFHMVADINKLFTGITLTASNLNVSTLADNAGILAGKIADNIASMFMGE